MLILFHIYLFSNQAFMNMDKRVVIQVLNKNVKQNKPIRTVI